MPPKSVVFHSEAPTASERDDETHASPSYSLPMRPVSDSMPLKHSSNDSSEGEEDLLGLKLEYVTQAEHRERVQHSAQCEVKHKRMRSVSFVSDRRGTLDPVEQVYPDDTDYPSDKKEFEAWQERQRRRGEL